MINPDQYNLMMQNRDVLQAIKLIEKVPAQMPEREAVLAILRALRQRNFEEIQKWIDEEDV